VSRYGLIAYAESLEQIGPMARFSRDLALILRYLVEFDERDITMTKDYEEREEIKRRLSEIVRGENKLRGQIKRLRFAYSRRLVELSDEPVRESFYRFLDKLGEIGVREIEDVDASFLEKALSAYYIIAMVEASSNLARYDGTNYGLRIYAPSYWEAARIVRSRGFGDEVKKRIIMGTYASSAGYYGRYYIKALKVRRYIKESMRKILAGYDFFLLPVSPSLPPKLGEATGVKGYILDTYTVTPNLTGQPAITIPTGLHGNLPTAVQVISDYHRDPELIMLAEILEGKIYDPNLSPG